MTDFKYFIHLFGFQTSTRGRSCFREVVFKVVLSLLKKLCPVLSCNFSMLQNQQFISTGATFSTYSIARYNIIWEACTLYHPEVSRTFCVCRWWCVWDFYKGTFILSHMLNDPVVSPCTFSSSVFSLHMTFLHFFKSRTNGSMKLITFKLNFPSRTSLHLSIRVYKSIWPQSRAIWFMWP